jgi:hypothetical protein
MPKFNIFYERATKLYLAFKSGVFRQNSRHECLAMTQGQLKLIIITAQTKPYFFTETEIRVTVHEVNPISLTIP